MNGHLFPYALTAWFCLLLFAGITVQAQPITGPQQVDSLLKEKASRMPVERKIDSQLLQAIKERTSQNGTKSNGLEPAKVNIDNNGNLLVDIDASVTDELLSSIEALGGKIIYPSKRYSTIRAQVPVSGVKKIAAREEVKFIKPAVMPMNNKL